MTNEPQHVKMEKIVIMRWKGLCSIMANVTIKDVAKHAGTSTATVSRVINGMSGVSPQLAQKVLQAAKMLDYHPNFIARSLKTDSTSTIAFIVSDISNPSFTAMAKAIEDVIEPAGYNLLMCSTDERKEKERRYLQLMVEKKVDGIILNTTGKNDSFVSSISHKVPMALSNRKIDDLNFCGDFVDTDNFDGVFSLTTHLFQHGHRRIGVIGGNPLVSTGRERFQGFASAMKMIHIDVTEQYPYLFQGDFTSMDGYVGGEVLMSKPNPPTAIIVMNNEMLVGALRYFHKAGIQIPSQLSLVAYGNITNSDLFYVQPTYVTLNPIVIGTKLGNILVERISSAGPLGNREIRFSPHLVEGNSVSAPTD